MSDIGATAVRRSGGVRVELTLEGVGARPVPYSRSGVQYAPRRLVLSYRQSDDLPWQYDSPSLSGPKLRQNGEPGSVWAEETLWSDVPDWVTRFAEAYTPVGTR